MLNSEISKEIFGLLNSGAVSAEVFYAYPKKAAANPCVTVFMASEKEVPRTFGRFTDTVFEITCHADDFYTASQLSDEVDQIMQWAGFTKAECTEHYSERKRSCQRTMRYKGVIDLSAEKVYGQFI